MILKARDIALRVIKGKESAYKKRNFERGGMDVKRTLIIILTLLVFILPAYAAEEGIDNAVADEIGGSNVATDYYRELFGLSNETDSDNLLDVPNVTVDDLGERLAAKAGDFVYLIKIVGRYVCLGAFIICCIIIVIGIIGNQRTLAKAIIGAIISGLAYAAITCGEQIVQFIAAWAMTYP